VQNISPNARFLVEPTIGWRGHEGRQWVDFRFDSGAANGRYWRLTANKPTSDVRLMLPNSAFAKVERRQLGRMGSRHSLHAKNAT
jgi:hypothetical protein